MYPRASLLAALLLFIGVTGAAAQDGWVQVTTPNFTVVANGGEKRARDIALQFERYRVAVQTGWGWARQQLDRPVVVIAAKDEATMKMLVPAYWEKGSRMQPVSVFATAPDAYFIALRSDVREEDTDNNNPYQTSYWSYTSLALASAFEHPLPLWFRNGFAAVMSNSIVRDDHIDFGRPPQDILRVLGTNIRLPMAEFLSLQPQSRYYTDSQTRSNFDAQCWAVMHYLLFGLAEKQPEAANQLVKLLLDGKSSVDAITEVFGSVDALEKDFVLYRQRPIYQFLRVKAPNTVSATTFTSRPVESSQVAAFRARYHIATGRPNDARALIDTLRARTPTPAAVFDVDGMLLDLNGERDEARVAYAKAADASSDSFFSLYRLAVFEWPTTPDPARLARVEALLRRAVAANNVFAPAHTMLATVLTSQNKGSEAVEIARRGAALAPNDSSARVALAQALWAVSRRAEARGQALAARALADTDQERTAVQTTLNFFDRATVGAAGPAPAASVGQSSTPAAPVSVPEGVFLPGAGVTPPRVVRDMKPQYTQEALANGIEGTVTLQAVVLPDGTVGDVQVTKSIDRTYGLDDEAIKAAKQWRFQPGTRDGSPVPVLVTIELSFTLRRSPTPP
jgi:TonB family protein